MEHSVIGGWLVEKVAGAIKSLVNARDLQLECAHETLLIPVVMYGSQTMSWKEKERFKIRAVQMDNLRRLLGIRRMDRVPNARLRELVLSGGSAMWRG